ncbi:MAG: M16 family metallopeptidase [Parvularculaceae bacterium]
MGELHALSNGLRVYIDPMPGLESAALGVWARAGAVDEQDGEHGVAHLLEHMAFKGTAHRSARDIAEEIETVGGYLNAATSHQRTGYYARILKNDMPLALDILADILTEPAFDAAELEKEKDVVLQEIGEARDNPDDAVFEQLSALAWGNHPLGLPILGTAESVKAQSRETLFGFMRRQYAPEEMVLAAAGAIEPDAFLALAERKFGAYSGGKGRAGRAAPAYAGGVRHEAREIEQSHLAVAFPGAAARDESFFAMRVFAEALGGGMASRLFQAIREERGLAYSVYAFADCFDEAGLLGVYAGTDQSNAVESARLIRETIEAMAVAIEPQEIDRARSMLKSSLLMSLESPAARIEAAAGQLFTFGEVLSPATLRERLDAVTLDDARACAAHALQAGAPTLAIVGPSDIAAVGAALGAR